MAAGKPSIRTSCPAATHDGATRQTAELSWPAVHTPEGHAGALLQLSSVVLPDGQHVALVDVFRTDAQVLVRCSPHHVQAPAQPLGTTLGSYAHRQLALEQVAADAQALLALLVDCGALDGLPAVQQLAQHLQHSVRNALEAGHE